MIDLSAARQGMFKLKAEKKKSIFYRLCMPAYVRTHFEFISWPFLIWVAPHSPCRLSLCRLLCALSWTSAWKSFIMFRKYSRTQAGGNGKGVRGEGKWRDEGKSLTLSSCVRSVILKSVVCLILIAVYIDLSESSAWASVEPNSGGNPSEAEQPSHLEWLMEKRTGDARVGAKKTREKERWAAIRLSCWTFSLNDCD